MKEWTYRVDGGYISVRAESKDGSWLALMSVYHYDPVYGSIKPQLVGIEEVS